MEWSEKQEAIRQAVALAAKLDDQDTIGGGLNRRVEWANRFVAQRWDDGTAWADLTISNIRGHGTDEVRYDYRPGMSVEATKNLPIYGGYRTFSVVVRIGQDSTEPGEEATAFISGRFRTRFRRDDVHALLAAADVALVDIGPTVEADYEDQGRILSLAVTELTLATSEEDQDVDEAGDYVANAQGAGEGDLTGVDFDITTEP